MPNLVVHWKKSKYDIYIGRPSAFGNPFRIGEDGDRSEVLSLYEHWLRGELEKRPALKEQLLRLRGKVLGCWCSPEPCHGDIIVKIIEELANADI